MRVVVTGMGPWPGEAGAVVTGPSIRLRQFVEPLVAARHEVIAVLLEEQARDRIPIAGVLAAASFTPEEILDPGAVERRLDLQFTGAVLGVGSLMPVAAGTRLAGHLGKPAWVDLFGDPLAEFHAAQLRQGGSIDLTARDHIWKLVREALLAGDAFSTVSAPQRHALLGQLGLLGRYGALWDVGRRLHEIPCAVPDAWTEAVERPGFPALLGERGMSPETPYIFFGGSWNVWLDEGAMGAALARALEQNGSLHFVAAGLPTGPHGEAIRRAVMAPLEAHRQEGRVHDIGPQDGAVEEALLAHAGACLSLDRPIPEAELGSRNRLLAMVRWGARPVVSLEAGVEALLVGAGLAAGIADNDPIRTAKELETACRRSAATREADREAGRDWLKSITFSRTLEPVRGWISEGAPRWPGIGDEGLVDRWARFPAEPEKLFGEPARRRFRFFR